MGCTQSNLQDNWLVECIVTQDSVEVRYLCCLLNMPIQGQNPATIIVGCFKFQSVDDAATKLSCNTIERSNIAVSVNSSNVEYQEPFTFIDVSDVEGLKGNGSDFWSTVVLDTELQYHSVTIWSDFSNNLLVPVYNVNADNIGLSTQQVLEAGSPVCLGRLGQDNLNIVGLCGPTGSGTTVHTAHRFTRLTFRSYLRKRSIDSFGFICSKTDEMLYLICRKTGNNRIHCWYGDVDGATKPSLDDSFFVYPVAALGNEVVVVLESSDETWMYSSVGIKRPTQTTLNTKVDCVWRYTADASINAYCLYTVDSNFMKGGQGGVYFQLRSYRNEAVCLHMEWTDRESNPGKYGGEVQCMVAESASSSTEIQFALVDA